MEEASSSNPKKRAAGSTATSPSSSRHQKKQQQPRHVAKPNVYQASAFLLDIKGRDTKLDSSYSKSAAPDEILAHVLEPPPEIPAVGEDVAKELPDSDLLRSLHHYAGKFYEKKSWGKIANKSMDESAMLAMGVLLEEMVRYQVGKNGDLAFTEEDEWENVDEDDNEDGEWESVDEDEDDEGSEEEGEDEEDAAGQQSSSQVEAGDHNKTSNEGADRDGVEGTISLSKTSL